VVNKGSRGFSLIELMVVVAVILIITALSIPQIQKVQTRYRLSTSGHAVAGLVQQARLEAVRRNQPAYVQFDNANPAPILVYVNSDKSPVANGNPVVTTNGGVTLLNAVPTNPGGLVDQLKAYLGTASNAVVEAPGTPIGFNPRGLPCIGLAANPAVCVQLDGTQIPAFLWLMTTGQGDYEAVTVTAAGRTKSWQLQKGVTGCGYANCWQ
jgi:prepilin-type N-terminal cleavage/methylation domain-containing protein